MTHPPGPETRASQPVTSGTPPAAPERWMSEIGSLLRELETVTTARESLPPVTSPQTDNQLIQVRLGIASSLFAALQCKHAATAGHSLRVALTCSGWALQMGLDESARDVVEVAALLHDIGVIGAPDSILLKPGMLNADEAAVMARARRLSLEILRQSCSSPEILRIVEHVDAWYDGSRPGFRLRGEQIPLGARAIAIAEAFDAMITDHVYRPAMSQERAMTELFDCAGAQFDPELVRQFAEFHEGDQSRIHEEVAARWLNSLDPKLVNSYWQLNCVPSSRTQPDIDALFQTRLLENMYDAVVFIDAGGRVLLWNPGAERLTGISGTSMCQRQWQPELLRMTDERGQPLSEFDCPAACTLRTGVQSLRRLTICGRNRRRVSVDAHTMPVMAGDGTTLGAVMLLHDASSETSLEERCQSLHEKATKDPLTQVANRAEFERVHATFVAAHQEQHIPCSLMICDLDRFKQVNDTYGHQAGDEVIRSLAAVLKSSCRPGDLVARYGGEEFVVLCADCDNAAAARRAERIRQALSHLPQPKMHGRSVTVSFGVTEVQPGDTPETMLRRADRALLLAKSRGRNMVVQLGTGREAAAASAATRAWSGKKALPKKLLEQVLVTPVPIRMAVEKLRGFVADHQAKIVHIDGNHVRLEIDDRHAGQLRRLTDRPVSFSIDLQLEEERYRERQDDPPSSAVVRTRIHLTISPRKNRDRRRSDVASRAREVLMSFRSYLMATEEETAARPGALQRVKRMLAPWLTRE